MTQISEYSQNYFNISLSNLTLLIGKGRGLVARKALGAGQLVAVENSVAQVTFMPKVLNVDILNILQILECCFY